MKFDKFSILKLCKASVHHAEWNALAGKRCIMVCHDQDIDRRILQESEVLANNGYSILIICLSLNEFDLLERKDNLFIHRIGLAKIIPDCNMYWLYQRLVRYALKLDHISHKFSNLFRKFLWLKYTLLCKLVYGNNGISYPLPFDYPFKYILEEYSTNLIIAHDLPALKAAVERGEELMVPVIYDAHEFYSEQKTFSRYQKKILRKYEQKYISKCADVLTINECFVELFKKRYNVKSAHVIRNSHKFHIIKSSTTLHAKIKKPSTQKVILFQGGVMQNRNLINLLKGFMLMLESDVNLVFMGPQDKMLVKKMQEIAGKDLERNIFFLDPVSQNELIDYTTTATFGVIPYQSCDLNTKYCTPNKLFEYIQAELPILYNNKLEEVTRTMSEMGGGGISCDMSSPNQMKKGLQKMLTRNLDNDRKILQNAKHDVCWETDAKKLMEIINEL